MFVTSNMVSQTKNKAVLFIASCIRHGFLKIRRHDPFPEEGRSLTTSLFIYFFSRPTVPAPSMAFPASDTPQDFAQNRKLHFGWRNLRRFNDQLTFVGENVRWGIETDDTEVILPLRFELDVRQRAQT